MTGWVSLGVYYAIALVIAGGVMVQAGRAFATRPETRRVLPEMFPWLEQHDTYANAVSIARYARERRTAAMVLVFASAPSVAAVATAAAGGRGADLATLVRTLQPWNHHGAGAALVTYGVILAVLVAVAAVYLRVASVAPVDPVPSVLRERRPVRRWGRIVGGAFIDEGGSLEELGWRGFALPLLVVATGSMWWATLLLAVAWWAWHLPREVPSLLRRPKWRQFATAQSQFVLLCIALSALMTVAWRHTGSVWPAVMIHGGTNVWSKAIGGPMWERTKRDVRTFVVIGLAVVVVAVQAAV
jgi:membrane protease YdiL (CAAX protease family)